MGWFSKKRGDKSDQEGSNPYSQESTSSTQDAYDPKPSSGYGGMSGPPPPAYDGTNSRSFSNSNPRNEKSPVPLGGYGGNSSHDGARFGGTGSSYANHPGYGDAGYGQERSAPQSRRPGGYGGMGSLDDGTADDPRKKDLFGGAPQRTAQQQSGGHGTGPQGGRNIQAPPTQDRAALFGNAQDRYQQSQGNSSYNSASNHEGGASTGYGNSGGGEPEDNEERQVEALKSETRAYRKEGIASLDRTGAALDHIEGILDSTMSRLGQQREGLSKANRDLSRADSETKVAGGRIGEIDRLNSRPFFMPVGKNRKQVAQEDAEAEEHFNFSTAERVDARRKDYESSQALGRQRAGLTKPAGTSKSRVHNPMYDLGDDEEDTRDEHAIEDRINVNLQRMRGVRSGAEAIGKEIEDQNRLIESMDSKAGGVESKIQKQTNRLNRIK